MRYMYAIYSQVKGRIYLHFCLDAVRTRVSCLFSLLQTFRCYFRLLNSSYFVQEKRQKKLLHLRKLELGKRLREREGGVCMCSVLLLPPSAWSPASRFSGKSVFPDGFLSLATTLSIAAPLLILQHTHR